MQTASQYEQPLMVSIESSEKWMENNRGKIEKCRSSNFSDVAYSTVPIAEFQGQISHFYNELPDVVPDFVCLDGPDPSTVKGSIHGLSFQNPKTTVMTADIIKYESTFLPGFFMIVDVGLTTPGFCKECSGAPMRFCIIPKLMRPLLNLKNPASDGKTFSGMRLTLGRR